MNFSALVSRIRKEKGLSEEVPGFDPANGNEGARYLFLLEAPGPKAVLSGQISFQNPDPTARNFKHQLEAAGIERCDIAIWNVVPWYIGAESRASIRQAARADVQGGARYLPPLLKAMPELKCIFLVGSAARRAHLLLSSITAARIVCCHHPSAKVMNTNPMAQKENIAIFKFVKATT